MALIVLIEFNAAARVVAFNWAAVIELVAGMVALIGLITGARAALIVLAPGIVLASGNVTAIAPLMFDDPAIVSVKA